MKDNTGDALDDLDMRIIRLLEDDGRLSNVEVARQLAISEATARRRIDRLLQDRVINVIAIPTPERITNQVQILVAIQTQAGTAEQLASDLAKLSETRYVAVTSGPFDILAEIIVPTHADLLNVLRTYISGRPEVKNAQTIMILHLAKLGHRPVGSVRVDNNETNNDAS